MLRTLGSRRLFGSRLASTLALIESSGGKINPAVLNALTAAKQLGNDITALYAGSDINVATEASKLGVKKVLHANNNAYDYGLPENLAPLIADTIQSGGFDYVVAPTTAWTRNVLPRVGALIDTQPVTDVIKIEDNSTFVRPIYAGNALQTVKTSQPIKLLTIRPTAFDASEPASEAAPIEDAQDPNTAPLSEFVSENLTKSERPDLSTANRVVSGGRGLKNKENFEKIMYPFADSLGAAVGASRAAVDAGFADNSLQVGQTGKVVAPELYIAVGISGAIQHLAGMKDSKTIAAVNKDEEAPIFHVADVGLVADLFDAVPKLTEDFDKLK